MPEGHAAFAGRRIWYRDSGGNGVPVIFLHAGTGSSLVWELQVPAFTAVGHRFIAYDRLGRLSNATRSPAQATRNRLSFPLLETIRVPTLLLTGDADLYTPPPVLELFAARIRDSVSRVLHGAGHSAYWEQPEVFNREVLAFLGKH